MFFFPFAVDVWQFTVAVTWKHFLLFGQLSIWQFPLHSFSCLPVSCIVNTRGQEEWRPVQLAFVSDSRKGGAGIVEDRNQIWFFLFFPVMISLALRPDLVLVFSSSVIGLLVQVCKTERENSFTTTSCNSLLLCSINKHYSFLQTNVLSGF